MKTMSDYTILCTSEQTKKALKLGAPIDSSTVYFEGFDMIDHNEDYSSKVYAIIPTAEEMTGWLEEQGMFIEINSHIPDRLVADWKNAIYTFCVVDKFMVIHKHGGYNDTIHYPSRKEATIAAIDAALDYLTQNK